MSISRSEILRKKKAETENEKLLYAHCQQQQEHKVSYRCSLPSPLQKGSKDYKILHRRERERFISSHDIGCIFSYKLRYFRQTCGAYMVNTDLLPAAPQIGILSSFFLVELPDSKSQLMEQIVLSIMVFCLGGSHQSLKIFCFNLKKVLKIKKKDQVRLKEVSDWH